MAALQHVQTTTTMSCSCQWPEPGTCLPAGQRMEKQYNPLQNLQTTTTLDSRLTSDQNDYPMRRLSEVPVLHSQGQAYDSPAGALACTLPWLEALEFF